MYGILQKQHEVSRAVTMSVVEVCEGCRRLRKRCDKDDCVLQPCLLALWKTNKLFQGNATVFLAKYFGRKRFFELLQDVEKEDRAELFLSLLNEACGRTINPISGSIGLKTSGRWHLCQEAVNNVLSGGSLNPPTSLPDASCASTTTSSSGRLFPVKAKRERDEEDYDYDNTRLPLLVGDSHSMRLPRLVEESRHRRRPDFDLNVDLSLKI